MVKNSLTISPVSTWSKMGLAVCLPNILNPPPPLKTYQGCIRQVWRQWTPNLSSPRLHNCSASFQGKGCCHSLVVWFCFWKSIIGSVMIAIEFVCCWHIRHLLTRNVLCNKFIFFWCQMEDRPPNWVLTMLHAQNLEIFLQVKVLQLFRRVYEFCPRGCHFWFGWRDKGRPVWWVLLN